MPGTALIPKNGGPPPREGELAIWRDGRLVGGKPMNLHTYGNAVALSRDGSTVAVATEEGRVLVVDAHTGQAERTIRPQTGPIERYHRCVLARRNARERLLGRHRQPLGSKDRQGARPPDSRRPGSG